MVYVNTHIGGRPKLPIEVERDLSRDQRMFPASFHLKEFSSIQEAEREALRQEHKETNSHALSLPNCPECHNEARDKNHNPGSRDQVINRRILHGIT